MQLSLDDMKELQNLCDPLIKYLNDNYHPHIKLIITSTSIELLEEMCAINNIYDHIKD